MKFFLGARTDEEYVEIMRRTMSSAEVSWAFQIFRILFFALLILLSLELIPWLRDMWEPKGRFGQEYSFVDGTVAGWMLCLGVYFCVCAMRALRGARAERLMLRFYHELHTKERDVNQTSQRGER